MKGVMIIKYKKFNSKINENQIKKNYNKNLNED